MGAWGGRGLVGGGGLQLRSLKTLLVSVAMKLTNARAECLECVLLQTRPTAAKAVEEMVSSNLWAHPCCPGKAGPSH